MQIGSDEDNEDFIVLPEMSQQQLQAFQKQQKQRLDKFYGNNKKYEISYWYQKLSDYTFKSCSFSLSVNEAYIIYCTYYQFPLNEEQQQHKKCLQDKIDKIISQFGHNNGVFMKLSTRSPKDYCWDYRNKQQAQQQKQKLVEYLAGNNVNKTTPSLTINNLLYTFFLKRSKKKLLIDSGQKFINVFGKSDRIIIDLNDFATLKNNLFVRIKEGTITQIQKNSEFITVWVRQWQQCQWSQQFRVFYHHYKLTAICQYDQYCYFPQLKGLQSNIQQRIVQFYEHLKPKFQQLELSQGVMDIMLKEKQVKLIEINVFNQNARASLYDWSTERSILQNGPLEVRLLKQQKQISKVHLGSMMGMIDKGLINVIKSAMDKIGLLQQWEKFV